MKRKEKHEERGENEEKGGKKTMKRKEEAPVDDDVDVASDGAREVCVFVEIQRIVPNIRGLLHRSLPAKL